MSEPVLQEIAHTLEELLKWSRFAGMQQLRNVLTQSLKTDNELLIYEASDGTRGARDVAQIAQTSHTTVLSHWRKWGKVGIVEPSPRFEGRYQKICSLEEVGLTAPPLPSTTSQASPAEEHETKGESD